MYHGFILVYLYVAKNETLGLKQPDMFTFNNAQIGLQALLLESALGHWMVKAMDSSMHS